jgi:hypothetical protein
VKQSVRALAMVLVGLSGCNRAPATPGGAGQIDVRWTGSERGRLSGKATAEWCSIHRLLEIRAIRGDTGIALAIYPADTITPGTYQVIDPAKAESLPPAAGIALRWATQIAIKGFQGESGSVVLDRSRSGELSGRVTAAARSVTDTQRVAIDGSFRDLPVRPQTRGCAPPLEHPDEDVEPDGGDAQPSDTQLH